MNISYKISKLAKHYGVTIEVFENMYNDGLIDKQSVNKAVFKAIYPEILDKYNGVKRDAFEEIAEHLGLSRHAVEAMYYNNRKSNHTCVSCGCSITSYRHYQKQGLCKECFNK